MQQILSFISKYIPQLIFALALVLAQLLFINSNIVGVYLFGLLYTNDNFYKVFISCFFITLLYDSVKINFLGTWAICFFSSAVLTEVVINIFHLKNELKGDSIRSLIFLTIVISFGALVQMYILRLMQGQALAITDEFSIVVLSIFYVVLHKIISGRKPYDYIKF